jgi:hypothetical protein
MLKTRLNHGHPTKIVPSDPTTSRHRWVNPLALHATSGSKEILMSDSAYDNSRPGVPRHNGAARSGHDGPTDRGAINRANSEKSTGPRTDAGKQRSKMNALRHGLTGQTIVMPAEDHAAYQRHSQTFLDEYQPKGATEIQLVQSLIDTSWRMNRAASMENNLYSLGLIEMENRLLANHPDAEAALAMAMAYREQARAYAQISIHSQRLARQYERTVNQLREIQEQRRAQERRDLHEAAKLLKMHKEDGLPYDPAEDGFVFSNTEIETYIHRDERRDHAIARAYAT